jgi:hypothetical protein
VARKPVRGVAIDEMPWTPVEELAPSIPAGPLIKMLSLDEETGAHTMLFKAPPGWSTPKPESHTVQQEDLLLDGECTFGERRLTAPAYLCFPAGYVHPAVRTDEGFTMLVTFSGPFDVEYHDDYPPEGW